MPTYDYRCTKCETIFEKFHGINETPEITCPECNSEAEKQIGMGAGVHYRGTGFYTTDYKNAPAKSEKPSCASGACPN
jgi:putative FmdB family regulatory protein